MKKCITAALAAAFFTLPSFAQWQGDSTVAIIAYWAKGDRAVYKTESVVTQVRDSVETVQHKSGGTTIIDILDETDTSYVFRLGYRGLYDSVIENELVQQFSAELLDSLSMEFRTNEFGSLTHILGAGDSSRKMCDRLPLVKKKYEKLIPRKDKQAREDLEQLAGGYNALFSNTDALSDLCYLDVKDLLKYHGWEMDTTTSYTGSYTFEKVIGGQDVESEIETWVDKESSDSAYVCVRSYASLDNDSLMPIMEKSVESQFRSRTADEDELQEYMSKWLEEAASTNMEVTAERYSTCIVHLGSGWPVVLGVKQVVRIKNDEECFDQISITETNYAGSSLDEPAVTK